MRAAPVAAEVVVLKNQGQVRGEVLPREGDRSAVIVQTVGGIKISLDSDQVAKVLKENAAREEYLRIAPDFPNTVEGQWELAEFCRKNRLHAEREAHLEAVLKIDPDHVAARRGLGYSQVEGKWMTHVDVMKDRGYQLYKGQWKLPQEIELIEERVNIDRAEKSYFRDLKRWREWLDDERSAEAVLKISELDDPYAVKGLSSFLKDEPNPAVRKLYLDALGNIGTPAADAALVSTSLYDPVEDLRLTAVDLLAVRKSPDVVRLWIQALSNNNNPVVNRAAIGLKEMENPLSIGPLIDALITTHKQKFQQGGPGSMSTSFGGSSGVGGLPTLGGGGGTGLSMGGKTIVVKRDIPNQDVLDALVDLTGKNYQFDVNAWRYWLASQKKAESLNGRSGPD
jgi:hypothetical protein